MVIEADSNHVTPQPSQCPGSSGWRIRR